MTKVRGLQLCEAPAAERGSRQRALNRVSVALPHPYPIDVNVSEFEYKVQRRRNRSEARLFGLSG